MKRVKKMTEKINLSIAGMEHMTKQPFDKRYALFCEEALGGTYGFDCETRRLGGHIGDYEEYLQAKKIGVDHPHSVVIKFYPDYENDAPSEDFLGDMRSLSDKRK